jgi:hypothetical protein
MKTFLKLGFFFLIMKFILDFQFSESNDLEKTESCPILSNFIKESSSKEVFFLGFDGRKFVSCNHENHDYEEFFSGGNAMAELLLEKNDSTNTIHYKLNWIVRDIRELWGQDKILQKIESVGVLVQNPEDCSYKLRDEQLDELIKLYPSENSTVGIELSFKCKTCSEQEPYWLFPKERFLKHLTGDKLKFWQGYY